MWLTYSGIKKAAFVLLIYYDLQSQLRNKNFSNTVPRGWINSVS